MRAYLGNCFWLMLPVLAINLLFAGALPPMLQSETFWRDIPMPLALAENLCRYAVTGLPALMLLRLRTRRQKVGLALYALGLLAYGFAWWPLITAPASGWSQSLLGLAAPAYTPALWLAGIGLIGFDLSSTFRRWVSWAYLFAASGFVIAHVLHVALVAGRVLG
ncbi:hypothetical protein WH87_08490 [Devosia epidermidihirudinis]|uniref:Uncharacterized protein n=1 Tax=Devosia epidermidihirudinis TaxID=1293439 RepID=A0A0F5QAK1_9HYPH|nr:hypothetical protein [Devosia epidermidihirudinis]KKC37741.1 hypothetical protein WH87_08490 [Devosia epidermidihirudinis]